MKLPPSTLSAIEKVTAYFLVIVTEAFAVFVGSAAAVALTVTKVGFRNVFGARYTPDELIVPTAELPPVIPSTFQMTDVFELSWTVAVNCSVRFIRTVAPLTVRAKLPVVTGEGLTDEMLGSERMVTGCGKERLSKSAEMR